MPTPAKRSEAPIRGVLVRRGAVGKVLRERNVMYVHAAAIDESLEDERLNAIADERADGPFVRVSLDDL